MMEEFPTIPGNNSNRDTEKKMETSTEHEHNAPISTAAKSVQVQAALSRVAEKRARKRRMYEAYTPAVRKTAGPSLSGIVRVAGKHKRSG